MNDMIDCRAMLDHIPMERLVSCVSTVRFGGGITCNRCGWDRSERMHQVVFWAQSGVCTLSADLCPACLTRAMGPKPADWPKSDALPEVKP